MLAFTGLRELLLSHRTVQQHVATTRFPAGPQCIGMLQDARQSHRRHPVFHLPLQPNESRYIERALHGHHYLELSR